MKIEDWLTPENIGFIALGVVIGAIGLVGVEAACDADVAARARPPSVLRTGAPVEAPPIDEELLRCAKLPIEQADDPDCREFWAKQRRRFLAPNEAAETAEQPLDMFPTLPKAQDKIAPKTAPAPEGE
jgi:conjugative transfer region protein TrbK